MTQPSIADALNDARLLGAAIGDLSTWSTWVACLKAAFGLTLNRAERRAFASVAGSRKPPRQKVRELWVVAGRRSGKSRVAGALACYLGMFIDHSETLAHGETGYVLTIAPTLAQSRL